MPRTRIRLDAAGDHHLDIDVGEVTTAALGCHPDARRSDLRWALRHHLRISGQPVDDTAEIAPGPIRVTVGDACLAHRAADLTPIAPDRPLTPYASRYLADNHHPAPPAPAEVPVTPITDLHSHFAGCVLPDDLLRIGAEHGAVYDRRSLARAGIESDHDLPVADLDERSRALLARALCIPFDRQITFAGMRRIYGLRKPVTKRNEAFVRLCRQVAEDYARMGVQYVELSLHQIIHAPQLEATFNSRY